MTTISPDMTIYRVLVHEAEEGGYWGEVLGLPGCVSQGESEEELMVNLREAMDAVLKAQQETPPVSYLLVEPTVAEKDSRTFFTHEPETWTVIGG